MNFKYCNAIICFYLLTAYPVFAETLPLDVKVSVKYKYIENVEERPQPWGLLALLSEPGTVNLNMESLLSGYKWAYTEQTLLLDQRQYKSNAVEPGITLESSYKDFNVSLYTGILHGISGEYRNNTTYFCYDCGAKRAEFSPEKFSFRDTAYTYKGLFNSDTVYYPVYAEQAEVSLKGTEINAAIDYTLFRNDSISLLSGTGIYYTSVTMNLSDFTSAAFRRRCSAGVEYCGDLFYLDNENLVKRRYWTRQIPLKLGFAYESGWINVKGSAYYLVGDGRFFTKTYAPGNTVFQTSDSRVKGDGWGYDFSLEKNITDSLAMGISFFGKRYFSKGKDYMHGSEDFTIGIFQETLNLMDYIREPVVYQGIREQGAGISLEYHF